MPAAAVDNHNQITQFTDQCSEIYEKCGVIKTVYLTSMTVHLYLEIDLQLSALMRSFAVIYSGWNLHRQIIEIMFNNIKNYKAGSTPHKCF